LHGGYAVAARDVRTHACAGRKNVTARPHHTNHGNDGCLSGIAGSVRRKRVVLRVRVLIVIGTTKLAARADSAKVGQVAGNVPIVRRICSCLRKSSFLPSHPHAYAFIRGSDWSARTLHSSDHSPAFLYRTFPPCPTAPSAIPR